MSLVLLGNEKRFFKIHSPKTLRPYKNNLGSPLFNVGDRAVVLLNKSYQYCSEDFYLYHGKEVEVMYVDYESEPRYLVKLVNGTKSSIFVHTDELFSPEELEDENVN